MSNIAGKAYAMNLVTPIKGCWFWMNKIIFWAAGWKWIQKRAFGGLLTLSLIHYARWVIIEKNQFPHLSPEQPKEQLNYSYMFFFSNFNGSWTQYVDSFSMAIPRGLNLLWKKNVGWPKSVPETPFNAYVIKNQIWTNHYYNAYPMSSSNDVKSAKKVKKKLLDLSQNLDNITASNFQKKYDQALLELQADISHMAPTPVVSLAHEAIEKRKSIQRDS